MNPPEAAYADTLSSDSDKKKIGQGESVVCHDGVLPKSLAYARFVINIEVTCKVAMTVTVVLSESPRRK